MTSEQKERRPIKIVADKDIPFLQGALEPYTEIIYKKGDDICREDLLDADALITRTRTICGEKLLSGTAVKAIATATIGTDHVDLKWCAANGIEVHNAPGCNAGGVMEYVFSALYGLAARKGLLLDGLRLGIVGVGHVGRRIEEMARYLGFEVLLCDPPRAAAEGPEAFCSLEELLDRSDIVSLHVPLQEDTANMAGEAFFSRMKPGSIFINASRGEVVDEQALMEYLPKFSGVIIDTWRNEPHINRELLSKVDIATPHIAGYSYQGKLNGTASVVRFIAGKFGIDALLDFYPGQEAGHEAVKLDLSGMSQGQIASILQYNYPIFTDDFMFRMDPAGFENLRNNYSYRREIYF